MKFTRYKQSGAAIVEFAIVLPVLLIFIFGIIEFGFLLYDQAVITNASREGARSGVVYAIRHNASGANSTVQNNAVSNRLLISLGATPSLPSGCSTNPCAIATNLDGGFDSGKRLQVAVKYNFSSLLLQPIIGTKLLQATTVMTYE